MSDTDAARLCEIEVLENRLEAAEKSLKSRIEFGRTMAMDFDAKLRTHRAQIATRDEEIRSLTVERDDLLSRIEQMSEGDYWATRAGELASEVAELRGRLKRIEDAVAGRDITRLGFDDYDDD